MLPNRHQVLIALAAALVSACSDVNSPVAEVAVRATVDRTQFRAGEEVRVAAEIRNHGATAARIPGFPTAFLEVRDASNRIVFFGRSGAFAAIAVPPHILEPGELVTDSPVWATQVVGADGGAAPAGTYRVRAAVRLLRRSDYVLDAANARYVFSEPIAVTVVER